MTAVYSPQKVVPSLSRPFTRWHTLHPTVINHLSPGRWISHFPPDFTATTLIPPPLGVPPFPLRPSPPPSSRPRPLRCVAARRSSGGGEIERDGDAYFRWGVRPLILTRRSSVIHRYGARAHFRLRNPPPGRGEAVRFPRERHCHCHSLTNRYEAVPIRYIIPRTCNASVATSPGL